MGDWGEVVKKLADQQDLQEAFYYRTKPKLLALVANGQIRQDLENMTVGIAHFWATRESVTAENFEEISKLYP